MMMSFRTGCIAASVLLGMSVSAAQAAPPTDVAAAVSPQVVGVVSGGTWEEGGKKGYYRAVLIAPPDANTGAQIFLQWMTAADQSSGGVPAIAKIVPVQEVADLSQTTADPGVLLDEVSRLLDAARRVLGENLFQRDTMVVEFAGEFLDGNLADALQTTFDILRKGSLYGAARAAR